MWIVFVFFTLKAVMFLLVTCMCDSAVTLRSPEIYNNIQYTPAHGVNRLKGFSSGSNLKGTLKVLLAG